MDEISRRHVFQLGSVATVSSLAGCFIGARTDYIDIEVQNEAAEILTFTLTLKGDFQPKARAETLAPDNTATFEEFIPLLDYNHTFSIEVVLDGRIVSTTRHEIGDLPDTERPVTLTINDRDSVSVSAPPTTE